MPTLIIGADICPIEANGPYFRKGDGASLMNDLWEEVNQADLVMANLEGPLVDSPSPIVKTGPTFGEPTDCIQGIKAAGIDVLGLANNHIMDHGAPGLRSTLAACQRAGVLTVGAGENLAAARKILVRAVGGLRIGLMAIAEHEFSIATADRPGAAPLDVIDFVRTVRAQQAEFDYLVVLLHGGDEFFVPTPRLQQTCRFLVEMGADAVIVQHPHCLGGYEQHAGGWIVYGQGAWVMDEAIYRDRSSFHEGFLVKLSVEAPKKSAMELLPFRQSDPVPGARRMAPTEAAAFLQGLAERSRQIRDPGFVEAEWVKFVEPQRHGYLSALLGHGKITRRLNLRGHLERWFYGHLRLARVRNLVCCETHREALETLFTRRIL